MPRLSRQVSYASTTALTDLVAAFGTDTTKDSFGLEGRRAQVKVLRRCNCWTFPSRSKSRRGSYQAHSPRLRRQRQLREQMVPSACMTDPCPCAQTQT